MLNFECPLLSQVEKVSMQLDIGVSRWVGGLRLGIKYIQVCSPEAGGEHWTYMSVDAKGNRSKGWILTPNNIKKSRREG